MIPPDLYIVPSEDGLRATSSAAEYTTVYKVRVVRVVRESGSLSLDTCPTDPTSSLHPAMLTMVVKVVLTT